MADDFFSSDKVETQDAVAEFRRNHKGRLGTSIAYDVLLHLAHDGLGVRRLFETDVIVNLRPQPGGRRVVVHDVLLAFPAAHLVHSKDLRHTANSRCSNGSINYVDPPPLA